MYVTVANNVFPSQKFKYSLWLYTAWQVLAWVSVASLGFIFGYVVRRLVIIIILMVYEDVYGNLQGNLFYLLRHDKYLIVRV